MKLLKTFNFVNKYDLGGIKIVIQEVYFIFLLVFKFLKLVISVNHYFPLLSLIFFIRLLPFVCDILELHDTISYLIHTQNIAVNINTLRFAIFMACVI